MQIQNYFLRVDLNQSKVTSTSQTSTKIFELNPTNEIKKQKWNDYKSAAVLVNNHEAQEFLDSLYARAQQKLQNKGKFL
jgi:hypothetical protein